MATSDNQIRRSQLIVPHGVGATYISKDGIRMLISGLDDWFTEDDTDLKTHRIHEWRLAARLKVDHFRFPKEYTSSDLTIGFLKRNYIPTVRFPQWHVCKSCHTLTKEDLAAQGALSCQNSSCKNSKSRKHSLQQVDMVCCCKNGHIHDFPWNEWVHQRKNPTCGEGNLQLIERGQISDATVLCLKCGAKRALTQTLSVESFSDVVHQTDGNYLCSGATVWHGKPIKHDQCGLNLFPLMLMRNNVYFPVTHSSIYLPRSKGEMDELQNHIEANSNYVEFCRLKVKSNKLAEKEVAVDLRAMSVFSQYTIEQISNALRSYWDSLHTSTKDEGRQTLDILPETTFRRDEYQTISQAQDFKELIVKPNSILRFKSLIGTYFSKVMLIPRLRETRVHEGFYRVVQGESLQSVQSHMFRSVPVETDDYWLPAVVNIGEGFFLELNMARLRQWESKPEVLERFSKLRFDGMKLPPNQPYQITPRAVLLHTISHLLINRLAYTSGYNAASIRERVYVSENPGKEMAGILIYTSSSDSEGSLGGLVRQAEPSRLATLLEQSLEHARWCSNDPVCSTDLHMASQDAVYSLAACHSCALLPETSCEFMNMFLDRSLVIDGLTNESGGVGFFNLNEKNHQ